MTECRPSAPCTTHTAVVTGRFAPSPTGPLHFGSIVAALASYLDVRVRAGRWLLRIDDLDTGRSRADAVGQILEDLEALGLEWHGEVYFQSRHLELYQRALEQLSLQQRVYPCACSRREVGGSVYPGTCRQGLRSGRSARSLRIRVGDAEIRFQDHLQGYCRQLLAESCGDFIIHRADGYFAYHLATVIDDYEQGVTGVLRGCDLLDATPRQIFLRQCLGLPSPEYLHIPVVTGRQGLKLSKQNHARRVDTSRPALVLCAALRHLGHEPPQSLHQSAAADVLSWAIEHWRRDLLPARKTWPLADPGLQM